MHSTGPQFWQLRIAIAIDTKSASVGFDRN